MDWPVKFADPTNTSPLSLPTNLPPGFEGVVVPESVVAICRFGDAIVEPVVRRVNNELRQALFDDGLVAEETESLIFAQYDAIFSMGKRRSEVHVFLKDHPW